MPTAYSTGPALLPTCLLFAVRCEGPAIHHLRRVPELRPSSKHPYCGCWAADYGPQGLEVLQLHYDFKGRAAQLHATKVVGDECVPSGQCSWRCAAAPMAVPWQAAEQDLVQQQEERWLEEREWWDDELDAVDEEDGGSSSSNGLSPAAASAEVLGGLAGVASGSGGSRGPPRVLAIHEGSGQVAGPGFTNPEWISGRLLVFADGALSFVWGEGLNQITEMRRLSMPRR